MSRIGRSRQHKEIAVYLSGEQNRITVERKEGILDPGKGLEILCLCHTYRSTVKVCTPDDIIGITNDNKLLLVHATGDEAVKMGIRDGLQFGPFLIVNGEVIKFNDAAGGYNKAARTAIAQRKDGVILFLVTEGVHANGPKLLSVAEFLKKYGAYNAANLDGGSSAQLVIKGKLINRPLNVAGQEIKDGRSVVSGFILMP